MDIIERVAERSFYICDNVEKRVLKEKMFYQDKDMGPFDIQENWSVLFILMDIYLHTYIYI